MPECGNIGEISKVLHEYYVKDQHFSVIDRLSRVPSKLVLVEVLYDALRGIKDEESRSKFSYFISAIENLKDSDAIYCAKLLALKALGGGEG